MHFLLFTEWVNIFGYEEILVKFLNISRFIGFIQVFEFSHGEKSGLEG